ncbi:MAG TPA: aminotransferase class III-fold pyridoxal phosphate-dependent enzyme [Usitatibacter sp.]|nr:aminotransferase class III-fold pyridoxal phosphate-dependent enzyme [Usitatibacter sp.]
MKVLPEITRASGCHAFDADGRRYLDLMNGFGAVFLGHGQPRVVEALREQVSSLWICGRLPTPAAAAAQERIREVLPAGMKFAGLCSTGMEAAEYAMRLAAVATGRREFAGFARGMHGKSGMTAAMCWNNAPLAPDAVHRLAFVDEMPEERVLANLEARLAPRRLAAVFVEPMQGSNALHEASAAFLPEVARLCRLHGTLLVADEILTGLYRAGTRFYCDGVGVVPDLMLFAKSMGNGFPVSSVAARQDLALDARSMPGSTFSGNPLASAAVAATLAVMGEMDLGANVAAIEQVVRGALGAIAPATAVLRGRGALWALEFADEAMCAKAAREAQRAGVLLSSYGRCIRLLPAATVDLAALRQACHGLARSCGAESPAAIGEG